MRIEAEQKIAGISAIDARQLMRRVGDGHLTPEWAAEILKVPSADKIIRDLAAADFITEKGDHWELTMKGKALARATSAKTAATIHIGEAHCRSGHARSTDQH